MYRILTASSDTMITDKIVANSFRATDANVGQAGTIDLFKLAGESKITGSTFPLEISRGLLKFDYDPIRALTSSILDINNPSFRCFLNLTDVYGGQTTPTNFTLIVHPLSKSFDEGFGRDVGQFQDLDSANFITASSRTSVSLWNVSGANAVGLLGSSNIDIIGSGTLDASVGIVNLWVTQTFQSGEENLNVDVTRIVSATLVGLIPDCGFRVAFSGTQETDDRTRFVKRFSSRHSTNPRNRPKINVTFDDSLNDDHEDFFFDLSGSLFLNNFHRGTPANILSGSSLTSISGLNSLLVTLVSGTFSSSFTGSQHRIGSSFISGVYSATFAIPSNNSVLKSEILSAGSATFTEVWSSLDRTVPYLSSTLVIRSIGRTALDSSAKRVNLNITNMKPSYRTHEKVRLRVFAQSVKAEDDYKFFRLPLESVSEIIRESYYQIRDANSNEVVIPFEKVRNTTKLSTDSKGMYFDFFVDSLSKGRVYEVDILISDRGSEEVYTSVGGRFRVDQ